MVEYDTAGRLAVLPGAVVPSHTPSSVSAHILAGPAKGRHQLREKALGGPQNGACVLSRLTASLPPSAVLPAAPCHLSAGDHRRRPCLRLLPAGEGPGRATLGRGHTQGHVHVQTTPTPQAPELTIGLTGPGGGGWVTGGRVDCRGQPAHSPGRPLRGSREEDVFTGSGALSPLLPTASRVTVPAQLTPDEPTPSLPLEPSLLLSQPACGPVLPHLGGS